MKLVNRNEDQCNRKKTNQSFQLHICFGLGFKNKTPPTDVGGGKDRDFSLKIRAKGGFLDSQNRPGTVTNFLLICGVVF
jgi:hypothetical protein